MKILVIGSGGREHALIWSLKKTADISIELYCAPGNAGIETLAKCVNIDSSDIATLRAFAASEKIDLTIVGPEAPLALGIVDEFQRDKLPIAGPDRAAARLESSKVFAKEFMMKHGIPTASYEAAHSPTEALRILQSGKFGNSSVVVKADGLAAGKGVIVASSHAEAGLAVEELTSGALVDREAARQIIIEEALSGTEASVLLFSDGRDYVLMPPARDHKRIGENDTGPNTGGMGAVTDAQLLDEQILSQVESEIIGPTLEGAYADGMPFRGVLFVGLMLTAEGPKVLEYNVRFGDPETQAILVRLASSLTGIFDATRKGGLRALDVKWTTESSACVVLASQGYPGKYEKGHRIEGLDRLAASEKVEVFHAGTTRSEQGEYLTNGGRVLGVTGTGVSLEEALKRAYGAVEKISWAGMQYRRDIGRFRAVSA